MKARYPIRPIFLFFFAATIATMLTILANCCMNQDVRSRQNLCVL